MNVYSTPPPASTTTLFTELVEQLGPPFIVKENSEGEITASLNQPMMTAIFADENLIVRDPALKQFFLYQEGGIWEDITEERLQHLFESLLRRVGEGLPITHLRARRPLSDLVAMLRGRVEKKDAFATRPSIINVQNGVLRVNRDGFDFTEHHPAYYSRNQAPVRFAREAKCPKFQAFLDRALPSKDDQLVVQLFGAQFMLGRNFLQRILILTGRAKSGKSTLMKILRLMVGRENVRELRDGQLDTRFETYSYPESTDDGEGNDREP